MSKCYRIEGDQLVDADTEEIGRSHYIIIHPDQIAQCSEVPGSWKFAKEMVGIYYVIPSQLGPPDGEELDALMGLVMGPE